LTATGRELLAAVARVLAPLPNTLLIEGHTDSRPYSGRGSRSNWELSGERANAARRVLEATGLDPTRIARVVGYADRQLLKPEEPFSDQNRRISITVAYTGTKID
jgi:chemotaxis protein MotB